MQEVYGPTRGNALLDLVLAMGEDRVGELQIHGHPGDSDHQSIKFTIQHRVGKITSRVEELDFRKTNFSALRNLIDNTLQEKNIGEMGVQEGWSFLKEAILWGQRETIPVRGKRGKEPKNFLC